MNNFSIKRALRLLRTELIFEGKGLLIALATSIGTLALIQMLNEQNFAHRVSSQVLNEFMPIYLTLFGIAYFVRIHKLLHQSSAQPFVSIPATVGEKFLKALLLGVIYALIAIITIQVNLWLESWLYPHLNYNPEYNAFPGELLISGTLLLNPSILLEKELLAGIIYLIGILMLISVSVRQKIFAYPLYFIVPTAIVYVIVNTIKAFDWNQSTDSEYLEILLTIIAVTIGMSSLIASYFVLRRKEVKS